MDLTINGMKHVLDVKTVRDVIMHFGLEGKPVFVELDGAVVAKELWADTVVRPQMKLELVHFVGGG